MVDEGCKELQVSVWTSVEVFAPLGRFINAAWVRLCLDASCGSLTVSLGLISSAGVDKGQLLPCGGAAGRRKQPFFK